MLCERLLTHHATRDLPLERKAFEEVVEAACKQRGIEVVRPSSSTNERWDLLVFDTGGPERWSLKTEGSEGIRDATINITKLAEASWVQTLNSGPNPGAALARELQSRIEGYTKDVQRLLILRFFSSEAASPHDRLRVYQLLEVPLDIFDWLLAQPTANVAAVLNTTVRNKAVRTIRVKLPGHPYQVGEVRAGPDGRAPMIELPDMNRNYPTEFSVGLDVNDGKLKVTGIPLSAWRVHALWTLLPMA